MTHHAGSTLAILAAVALLACGSSSASGSSSAHPTGGDQEPSAPVLTARAPRRITAEQLARSLEVATGQSWQQFEARAATLGRPDYLHTLSEGEQFSVAFVRFAEEGARATCAAAVSAERDLHEPAERPILGAVRLEAPDPALRRANLRRLVLRFLGTPVTSDDDSRLSGLLPLLDAPIAGRLGAAEVEGLRWIAVCVSLATRLDFLSY